MTNPLHYLKGCYHLLAMIVILGTFFHTNSFGQQFVHPGILHGREDLIRMKNAVADKLQPIFEGFQLFEKAGASRWDYQMQGPMKMVGRNPTIGQKIYDEDANAAHQNAVMWTITGDRRYAQKSIEIINAWSAVLTQITGRDAVLMAGLGPFKMVNAAEIIRYTDAGWQPEDIRTTAHHFKHVIYPVIKDFAPFANGNWEAAALKTAMAIGVFCNDRPIFERAIRYYTNGWGDGRLSNYVINDLGQGQESGRDQAHSQLGLALLADCAEIAWQQGLDLYGYSDNLLLKGFEYTAKYNLGNEVPFNATLDRTGKYAHTKTSTIARGNLRAVYEQVYNHYVKRRGLSAPFVSLAAAKIRPEGPGNPGADHPGYGTLYYSLIAPISAYNATVPPSGLIAKGSADAIVLSWVAARNRERYSIKRAERFEGPYHTIAKDVDRNAFTDQKISAAKVYYYVVSTLTKTGESENSFPVGICAGLPKGWHSSGIHDSTLLNASQFDGQTFRLEGTASQSVKLADAGQFTWTSFPANGELTLRYQPQLSSQFTQFGISLRAEPIAASPLVSLLVVPGKTEQIEAPAWQARWLVRTEKGGATTLQPDAHILTDPAVTHGRLTGYYWLRMKRRGDAIEGFGSVDGQNWEKLGAVKVKLPKNAVIGIIVNSGMANTTTLLVDQVILKKKS